MIHGLHGMITNYEGLLLGPARLPLHKSSATTHWKLWDASVESMSRQFK